MKMGHEDHFAPHLGVSIWTDLNSQLIFQDPRWIHKVNSSEHNFHAIAETLRIIFYKRDWSQLQYNWRCELARELVMKKLEWLLRWWMLVMFCRRFIWQKVMDSEMREHKFFGLFINDHWQAVQNLNFACFLMLSFARTRIRMRIGRPM